MYYILYYIWKAAIFPKLWIAISAPIAPGIARALKSRPSPVHIGAQLWSSRPFGSFGSPTESD